MKRVWRSAWAGERQRRLAEKHERLSDYRQRLSASDNHIDAMSADSFPASDPPSLSPAPRGRQRQPKK